MWLEFRRVLFRAVSQLIFSVETHSGKELRHFKFLSVSFMAQLLASSSFVGKVSGLFTVKPVFIIVVSYRDG